jgi:hypothetical protein
VTVTPFSDHILPLRIDLLRIAVENSHALDAMAPNPLPTASPDARVVATAIALHILCPQIPVHNRITIANIPLSTTIAQLKNRLAALIATHPPPTAQRLFYGGKRLEQDDATLEAVLAPIDVRV